MAIVVLLALQPATWSFGLLVPFTIVAIATGLAEITVVPERQTILNDLFYIVPFVFFPVPMSAAMLVALAVTDPLIHPRSFVRTMARLSSILPMRLAALGGVVLAGEVVPSDRWWTWAAIALGGLAAERINDYLIFPIALRLGLGPEFSYRSYVVQTVDEDLLILAIEAPLISIAASAFPLSPWLVLGLAVPYFAAWRLALLRPTVDALREADQLKSHFLSMASHELRTPLTAIGGFSSTLHDRWDEIPDEQRREFLGIIDEQSRRLGRLIDQLLTMSALEAGALSTTIVEVDLQPVVARAVSGAGDGQIDVNCPSGICVHADTDHLEQILINLIANAIKYGGDPIQVNVEPRHDVVEISVVDHGPGIPEEFVPAMFDQFTQAEQGSRRRSKGTGLGLSIVKRLADAQDIDLGYAPVDPSGARFVVTIPRSR